MRPRVTHPAGRTGRRSESDDSTVKCCEVLVSHNSPLSTHTALANPKSGIVVFEIVQSDDSELICWCVQTRFFVCASCRN